MNYNLITMADEVRRFFTLRPEHTQNRAELHNVTSAKTITDELCGGGNSFFLTDSGSEPES